MTAQNYEQEYIFDENNEEKLELKLTNFSGPLDLLLTLVKENKIEIKDIFVSEVTEQFMDYMSQLSELDVDKASEYMAIAATLIEIKSRALLPVLPGLDDDDNSPEKVLIRQLEEYKVFKEIVSELKEYETVDRFFREPDKNVGEEVVVVKENLSVEGFMQAFSKFLMKMQIRTAAENVSRAITKESFSVPQKIAYLKERLEIEESFSFFGMFNEETGRNELITTFIAVLEMLKLQLIKVRQNDLFEEIIIEKRSDAPDASSVVSEEDYDTVG